MAGDISRKVRQGDPLDIGYRTWNDILDMLADWKRSQGRAGNQGVPPSTTFDSCIVDLVNVNQDESNRAQYEIFGIKGPYFTQADSPYQFAEKVLLEGVLPDPTLASTNNFGNFAVALEPIPYGAAGRCIVCGVVPCKVNFDSDLDDDLVGDPGLYSRWADISYNDPTQLSICDGGSAQILWAADGGGTSGTWALVRLGNRQGGLFPVALIKDGGANGTPPTYTYTVYTFGGQKLATAQAPMDFTTRPSGPVTAPATWGYGYWSMATDPPPITGVTNIGVQLDGGIHPVDFVLLWANEVQSIPVGFNGMGTYTTFTIVDGIVTAAS